MVLEDVFLDGSLHIAIVRTGLCNGVTWMIGSVGSSLCRYVAYVACNSGTAPGIISASRLKNPGE